MIYSVYTKTWAKTYKDVMFYFNRDVLKNGEQFFKEFGQYLDTTKFPCDKLILCISHSGDMEKFAFYFNYNNAKIGYVELMHNKDLDLFDVRRIYFENEAYNIFKPIISEYFKKLNNESFNKALQEINVSSIDAEVEIAFDMYENYKCVNSTIKKNTLPNIIDYYVTYNDRMRYCNGSYVKFKDKKIEKVYLMFIKMYDGNYFIDNAVKRGVIID